MVRPLPDTNILVDHLRGHEEAREELRRYPAHAISIITWMEVMVGAADEAREATIGFLKGFSVMPVDDAVA